MFRKCSRCKIMIPVDEFRENINNANSAKKKFKE